MLNEFLNKQITVPMYRYEQLIENETRYNQLFEWQHEHGNDEILRTIDNEKLKELKELKDEETAATEEVVEDYQYKVGDIVKIVKVHDVHEGVLRIGNEYEIIEVDPKDCEFTYRLNNHSNNWVCDEEIKLVKKGEEN